MSIDLNNLDFSHVETARSFPVLPAGRYAVEVLSVRTDGPTTKTGHEMWGLQLAVLDGPHKGRRVFDNLVFSETAMPRLKLILDALGVDVTRPVRMTADLILHRKCYVTVEIEGYQGVQRSKVRFDGYEELAPDPERAVDQELDATVEKDPENDPGVVSDVDSDPVPF